MQVVDLFREVRREMLWVDLFMRVIQSAKSTDDTERHYGEGCEKVVLCKELTLPGLSYLMLYAKVCGILLYSNKTAHNLPVLGQAGPSNLALPEERDIFNQKR